MSYNRLERRIAAVLDAVPGLRRLAKSGYQRLNYALHGGHLGACHLAEGASLRRVPAPATGAPNEECFFGYFGTSPWSNDGLRYLLHRWPGGGETVDVCIHDISSGTTNAVASTLAWNFQQGSMAQWLPDVDGPGSIVFNDRVGDCYGCRIQAPDGSFRALSWPVQAVHPRLREAISISYLRVAQVQPEYGYGTTVRACGEATPDADGLWRVGLDTGEAKLLVSIDELARRETRPEMRGAHHAVNHVVYSPRGTRMVFMHRWLGPKGLFSRLYAARADGSGLRLLFDERMVSHYAWRDEGCLLVYARTAEFGDRYYLVDCDEGSRRPLGDGQLERFGDGHPSFSPDGRWIVSDSYPDRARMRRLLLCRVDDGAVIEVGAFFSPWRYEGAHRCDLHPRWHAGGRHVSIDSAHEGVRANYIVDVARLIGAA